MGGREAYLDFLLVCRQLVERLHRVQSSSVHVPEQRLPHLVIHYDRKRLVVLVRMRPVMARRPRARIVARSRSIRVCICVRALVRAPARMGMRRRRRRTRMDVGTAARPLSRHRRAGCRNRWSSRSVHARRRMGVVRPDGRGGACARVHIHVHAHARGTRSRDSRLVVRILVVVVTAAAAASEIGRAHV